MKIFKSCLCSIALTLVSMCAYSCTGSESGVDVPVEETKQEEVRGVWVPAPRFTDVLTSYDKIESFVNNLVDLKMNAIFMVAFANEMTIYDSEVLLKNTTYSSIDQTNMFTPYMSSYSSSTNDPVEDIIELAHANGIKVFFWYEYGFMCATTESAVQHSVIRAKHPEWMGIASDGGYANYNSHDYYFNSFDPQVQNFLLELISEALKRYPQVDGIQGDDRMPAAPRNSGYDAVTKQLFKADMGYEPPTDYNNLQWVEWRLDQLNDFGKRLYGTVKALAPNAMVSFSPNPYPWCENNLMQDWPQWISDGIVDLLAVQCYRRDLSSYKATVEECIDNINSAGGRKPIFAPGVLMQVGSDLADPAVMQQQLIENKMMDVDGAVFFYNKGLESESMRTVLRQVYTRDVIFPEK